MEKLLKSKAFYTALISTIAVLVMRYTSIPEEVWQSIAALLGVIVIIFTGEEVENGISRSMERAVGEIWRLTKK
jgi:hypothetical protein